ncbi:MAG: hypothetical protein EOO28_06395 [Comamonadaceae bacterium]|nr:MAG: hypothetical protein EOO28_06395 [Comamonadaceae bacterium]
MTDPLKIAPANYFPQVTEVVEVQKPQSQQTMAPALPSQLEALNNLDRGDDVGGGSAFNSRPSTTPGNSFQPGDALALFKSAARRARVPVTVYRGDRSDSALLSHQAAQQKKAGVSAYLEKTNEVLDEVYSSNTNLMLAKSGHKQDSTAILDIREKFRGSPFVSVTRRKETTGRYATTDAKGFRADGTIYELEVPRGRLLKNAFNATDTGFREDEHLVGVRIEPEWVVGTEVAVVPGRDPSSS